MGEIIKGKPVADAMTEALVLEVEALKKQNIHPKLKIVRVGAHESDLAYERGALKRMEKCGVDSEVLELPLDITQDDFIKELTAVNNDSSVNGILLFRPLPKQLDEEVIKHVISADKDIDCLNPQNVAKVMEGDKTGFPPCTPTACVEILKHYNVPLSGANVCVIGRSMVVGKPVAMLLLDENSTVTITHSRTVDLPKLAAKADIVIAAVGRANLVKKEWLKEGAVVIDVGINVDEEGNMFGDADTNDCLEVASMVTPVPAGVGSVTSTVLAKHVIKAAKLQNNL